MAFSANRGLSYFPMDTTMVKNPEIRGLTRRCGSDGLYIYLILVSAAYAGEGYYVRWTENLCGDTADTVRCPEESVQDAVAECVRIGLFDSERFAQHGILTSADIQTRYAQAVKERVRMRRARGGAVLCVKKAYWVAGDEILEQMGILYEEDRVREPFANTDHKEKENKEERKEDQRREEQNAPDMSIFDAAGDHTPLCVGLVTLEEADYEGLCAQFGRQRVDAKIAHLDCWMRQSGRRVTDTVATLWDWLSRDAPLRPAFQAPASACAGKRTDAHYASQRICTDEEQGSLYADIDLLNP